VIDVLEGNYGGDPTKMPFVVNKEAFEKWILEKVKSRKWQEVEIRK